jgi:lysophospholipase L1-like esterase
MSSLRKKRIALLSFSTLLCALALLLFEAGTRVFCPEINFQDTERFLIRRNVFGDSYGWTPNASGISFGRRVTIDEFGFRRLTAPQDYTSSWLVLGDSVTFGVGVDVENTYVQLLQNNLSTVKLWNTSVIGYDMLNHRQVVNRFVLESQDIPNIKRVLLFFCLNDVDLQYPDTAKRSRFEDLTSNYIDKGFYFLSSNSKFYILMKNVVSDRSEFYFWHDYQFYKDPGKKYTDAMNILDKINTDLRQRGIDFTVVILPYEYQLRAKEEQRLLPQQLLAARFKEKGIAYIDTYTHFERTGGDPKANFLYSDFCHFSSRGHQLVASALKEQLKAE